MSWRTVMITHHAKLSYKTNRMVVQTDNDTQLIPINEISTVVLESTQIVISAYLISALVEENIKIIFCDDKRTPVGEINGYYGNNVTTQNYNKQFQWEDIARQRYWTYVVANKMQNQLAYSTRLGLPTDKIEIALTELELNDASNREAYIAKIYFNLLFGDQFRRDEEDDINAALNYGYQILLSSFNKEIIAQGYLTQRGIHHHSGRNAYNLSCDLMEPFRPYVDRIVYTNIQNKQPFDSYFKIQLVDVLNTELKYREQTMLLSNVIQRYTKDMIDSLNNEKPDYDEVKFTDEE